MNARNKLKKQKILDKVKKLNLKNKHKFIPSLTPLGNDFIVEVCRLHSTDLNWNETGLSDKGQSVLNNIISEHNLS